MTHAPEPIRTPPSAAGSARSRFFAPLRPILPALLLLVAAMTAVMLAGFYVMFTLNHPGDQTVLILLAGMVYPGPFVLFGIFGFFLFHARHAPLLTLTYNSAALLMVAAALIIDWPRPAAGPLPDQLYESLFAGFLVSAGIGGAAIGLLLLFAQAAKKPETR